jgi:hypothetical protein
MNCSDSINGSDAALARASSQRNEHAAQEGEISCRLVIYGSMCLEQVESEIEKLAVHDHCRQDVIYEYCHW